MTNINTTSIKEKHNNEDILIIDGVKLELAFLKDIAKLDMLSDIDMKNAISESIIEKKQNSTPIESVIHANIPFKYVFSKKDKINRSKRIIKKLYPKYIFIPQSKSNFIQAHSLYQLRKQILWDNIDGIIIQNKVILTFSNTNLTQTKEIIK